MDWTVVLFTHTKWRKLASCAEQIILTPNQLRGNVTKHFGFYALDENIINVRLFADFVKCDCLIVSLACRSREAVEAPHMNINATA